MLLLLLLLMHTTALLNKSKHTASKGFSQRASEHGCGFFFADKKHTNKTGRTIPRDDTHPADQSRTRQDTKRVCRFVWARVQRHSLSRVQGRRRSTRCVSASV
uniref:Putative secreted peptide n=1 Tax=Anopheles braziliensis TaxID=58242 RepID=A0A2M3ZPZ5_9DIPT